MTSISLSMFNVWLSVHVESFSADVLGGSINEPLEPGGAGEEGPGELPHPLTTDH